MSNTSAREEARPPVQAGRRNGPRHARSELSHLIQADLKIGIALDNFPAPMARTEAKQRLMEQAGPARRPNRKAWPFPFRTHCMHGDSSACEWIDRIAHGHFGAEEPRLRTRELSGAPWFKWFGSIVYADDLPAEDIRGSVKIPSIGFYELRTNDGFPGIRGTECRRRRGFHK